jgi:microcystin-dependent protein
MAVNIKISELDPFPSASHPIAFPDFFPLVNSSSMTTYRATVGDINYTIGSTLLNYINNGAVSSSMYSVSASFASQSISASYADVAENVNIHGGLHYFPAWNTNYTAGTNGALSQTTQLYESVSLAHNNTSCDVIVIDPSYSAQSSLIPNPTSRPDYILNGFWNYRQNFDGGSPYHTASGIFTARPIVSAYGCMTDQSRWTFVTGSYPVDVMTYPQDASLLTSPNIQSYYWSGSSNAAVTPNNGFYAIGHGVGALKGAFNGKWVRLSSYSIRDDFSGTSPDTYLISSGSSYGEQMHVRVHNGLFGRVRISLTTTVYGGGSNTHQVVDMHIHNGMLGGGITAQVFHASTRYGYDHIRKLRLSTWTPRSNVEANRIYNDPMYALDIFVDDLTDNDHFCSIRCESWGNVRFLEQPNIDPPPLYDTGSAELTSNGYFDPKTASYLIFPAAPGYYSTNGDRQEQNQGEGLQPYMFQGKKIQIDPNRNMITESAWSLEPTLNYKPYSLWVSGSISTHKYWAEDDGGQSGQIIGYDPVLNDWKQWTCKGGILTYSGSATITPSALVPKDTVAVGTIMAYGGATVPQNWLECDGAILATSSYWELHRAILSTDTEAAFGYTCDAGGTRNAGGHYFKLPDLRGEFVRGWAHNRDVDTGRVRSSHQDVSVGDHYHGVGNLQENDNSNALFINRNWNDGATYTGLRIIGYTYDGPLTVPNSASALATSNPIATSNGDTRPRNIAAMYIIKYTGAIDFATDATTLAGDCTGNAASNTVEKIRGVAVDTTAPSDGQVLTYDSGVGKWTPSDIPTPTTTLPGKSWIMTDPNGFFGSVAGDPIYVATYNSNAARVNIAQLTMATNAIKPCITASHRDHSDYYSYQMAGRLFNTKNVPAVTGSVYRSFAWAGQGCFEFIPNAGSLKDSYGKIVLGTPGAYGITVVSCSYDSSWGSQPRLYTFRGSTDYGCQYPNFGWSRYTWNGASSYIQSDSSLINFRNVNNSEEFLRFMDDYPSTVVTSQVVWLYDYNYIKKRFYVIMNGTGFLHTFLWTGASDPFQGVWDSSNITYETSMAIPSVNSSFFYLNSGAHPWERMIVDYHPDTGVERGLVYWCRQNATYMGVFNYVYWPLSLP